MATDTPVPPGVDPTKPNVGRMYDLVLGGTNYFEADVKAVEAIRQFVPETEDIVWANRGFLQRATKWLAEHGIRQFIDVGAGLPTRNNTHEAAQAVGPDARVVYVDIDPMIVAHGRDLLKDTPHTVFIQGDLRDPDGILNHPEVRELIDFDEPVAMVLAAVLHFVSDDDDPWGLVARYMAPLVSGSYLALSHATYDRIHPEVIERFRRVYDNANEQAHFRSKPDVERFFDGLEIVPPYDGAPPVVTFSGLWDAEEPADADSDGSRWIYCAVARKP
jgi:O-methyltransferase involved in polyketide biosynthesis